MSLLSTLESTFMPTSIVVICYCILLFYFIAYWMGRKPISVTCISLTASEFEQLCMITDHLDLIFCLVIFFANFLIFLFLLSIYSVWIIAIYLLVLQILVSPSNLIFLYWPHRCIFLYKYFQSHIVKHL